MMEVLLTTLTAVAAVPPKLTVAPGRNPVPVIVTAVPPLPGPAFGVIEVIVGAGLEEIRINFATEGTPALLSTNSM